MGLCKCPKRKVTNLFCFEHRVNVCEYCLIENHPKCTVRSYLDWLKDSDFSSICTLCNVSLSEGEVVRLLCHDLFHLQCLGKHCQMLPPSTAPAGYRCYNCDFPIFPVKNEAGYVAETLCKVLSKYNWARTGLGLPLIEDPYFTTIDHEHDTTDDNLHGLAVVEDSDVTDGQLDSLASPVSEITTNNPMVPPPSPWNSFTADVTQPELKPASTLSHSTVLSITDDVDSDDTRTISRKMDDPRTLSRQMDDPRTLSRQMDDTRTIPSHMDDTRTISRKMLAANLPTNLSNFPSHSDPDGADKYKRRPAWSWFRRWLKSRMLPGRNFRDSKAIPRRFVMLLILGLLILFTLIVFATKTGRRYDSDDPNFDPMRNPNVHVARGRILPPNFDMNEEAKMIDAREPPQAVAPALPNLN